MKTYKEFRKSIGFPVKERKVEEVIRSEKPLKEDVVDHLRSVVKKKIESDIKFKCGTSVPIDPESAKTATTATELSLGKATAVAVYASAISIISVVENDGTEGGTSGTVQGSITVPAASLTVIHKDTDQFILANVTNGTYTVIASSGT